MKYFIITKKHINILKIFVAVLAVVCVFFAVFLSFAKKSVKTFSPVQILEKQLPEAEETEKKEEKNVKKNIFSAENIFSEYSAIFGNGGVEKTEEVKPDAQVQEESEEENKPEEKSIVEIKAEGMNELKNQTKYEVNIKEFENEEISLSSKPVVLILHTHTTESYAPEEGSMNFITDNSRSCEDEKNMITIGNMIGETLQERGIEVIHDKTYHDYPVYNGAYGRSLSTINTLKEKNPKINIILDVHRDAVVSADGAPAKFVCEINGEKTAQIMFVVGTNGGGLEHPGWGENLTFAANLQKTANEKFPGLMRPVNLRDERFNQHISPCSIIIEVGTNANTLSEAKAGAKRIGECIADVLSG